MKIENIGLGLIALGVAFILIAVIIAYQSFYGYKLPGIPSGNIDQVIASLVNTLIEIAVRLGFLGIVVWAGSILLKYGIQILRPKTSSEK